MGLRSSIRYEVERRRRPDPMSISSPRDFRYRRGEVVAANAVIDDPSVTLYCLDRRRGEAVFVETPTEVDLTGCPFYYQGQFEHARWAIVMPLTDFHDAAERKGDRFERAIMVHSVGRCGSTLLSKMFASLPPCVSVSEPDVQTQLIAEPFAESQLTPLLRSAARHYYQPRGPATHLVMKFRSFCIELGEAMHAATDNCSSLFLYRDIERVIVSGMRAFRYLNSPLSLFDRLHQSAFGFPLLAGTLAWNRRHGERLFPAMRHFTTSELVRFGPVGMLAIAWVSAMEKCLALQAASVPIKPIHYDDLIAHPEHIAAELLDYCGFNQNLVPHMLAPLGRDSQAGSIIERSRQQRFNLTPRDRQIIRDVLSRSDIIDSGDFRLPGTLGEATA